MTVLNTNFNIVNKDGPNGLAPGGIWDALVPSEIAAAQAAGSGAGVPDSTGTVQLGTVVSGTIMALNSSGQLAAMSSTDLTSNFRQMAWVVFEGDDDYSAAQAGSVSCVHGGVRIETTMFTAGQVYTPGAPLIAVSGSLQPKAGVNDHIQEIGWVGPNGLSSAGILDAYLAQGM